MKDSFDWHLVDSKHGKAWRFKTLDELLTFIVRIMKQINFKQGE